MKKNISIFLGIVLFGLGGGLGFWIGWEQSKSATTKKITRSITLINAYAEALRLKNLLDLREIVIAGDCEKADALLMHWSAISVSTINKGDYIGTKYENEIKESLDNALNKARDTSIACKTQAH